MRKTWGNFNLFEMKKSFYLDLSWIEGRVRLFILFKKILKVYFEILMFEKFYEKKSSFVKVKNFFFKVAYNCFISIVIFDTSLFTTQNFNILRFSKARIERETFRYLFKLYTSWAKFYC